MNPMNKSLLSAVIALVITFGGVNVTLLNAASHSGGHEDHTELGEQMETISKTFRSLRRQARDASKNAASAELAGKMLAAAKEAIKHEPAWTADQPKSEQAEFVAGFKKGMEHMIALLVDLEAAFKAGDNDKADEIIGKLREGQKEGHKAYKKPDDE